MILPIYHMLNSTKCYERDISKISLFCFIFSFAQIYLLNISLIEKKIDLLDNNQLYQLMFLFKSFFFPFFVFGPLYL